MRISRLQVIDFRNYTEAQLEFAPGPNVLLGSNGQGKTNLLEAVGYLATLNSHRVSSDVPLIRRGADRAVVRAVVANDHRELTIELEITAGKANRARLNKSPVARNRDIIGIARSVLFAPEDLSLVRGDPGDRRRFLDELLVLRFPRYAAARSDYDRVLRQRNALLRTAGLARRAGKNGDLSTLEVWDRHLVGAAAVLLHGRLELVAALRPHYEAAYGAISGAADDVGMRYRASGTEEEGSGELLDGIGDVPDLERELTERLIAVRAKEIERGLTLIGPHRDELVLNLDDFPAKGYASHGQSWSIALALRLASYDLLRAEGSEPVLMLDDVFAELDTRRRNHLSEVAAAAEQTLITAAVADDVPDSLRATIFEINAGQVLTAPKDDILT